MMETWTNSVHVRHINGSSGMSSTELLRSSTESPKRYIKQKTDRYIKQKNDRETFKKLVPFFFFFNFLSQTKNIYSS